MHKLGSEDPNPLDRYEKEAHEIERGKAVDTFLWGITTARYKVNILDAPGHQDFINCMFTRILQADAALVIVPANVGAFEGAFSEGGPIREHILLVHLWGVKQLIIGITQMEATNWSKDRYFEVVREVSGYIKKIGYDASQVPFVPMSHREGDNIMTPSSNLPWYKGVHKNNANRKTLLEALDAIEPSSRPDNSPLRFPVQTVSKINGSTVVAGRVASGVIKPGMDIIFAPAGPSAKVQSLETEIPIEQGIFGDSVSFKVDVPENKIHRGMVAGDAEQDPPKAVASFTAHIIILNSPKDIKRGYTPVIDCHTSHIACKFVEFF
ncbi:unnamed protein product [Periconia digitata]|uniref:Elongation factor 1-alpha n=1 Tax=Periconia digitata TaxID=1303443 RepID=A0A9W4UQT7_9PLEO|nr:unnamed protein product [Periconia digitata]